MPQQTKKIQYYPKDLAYALGIGEIVDMYVENEHGAQVLRIEHLPVEKEEYETVRVRKDEKRASSKNAGKIRDRKPAGTSTRQIRGNNDPESLGQKLMTVGKDWLNKKDKPEFMKDAGF